MRSSLWDELGLRGPGLGSQVGRGILHSGEVLAEDKAWIRGTPTIPRDRQVGPVGMHWVQDREPMYLCAGTDCPRAYF